MWNLIFSVLSVILCVGCLAGCLSAVLTARAERDSLLRKLRSCESRTTSAELSIDEMRELVAGVINSQKMARVRKASLHAVGSSGEPDPKENPEAWRAWMNTQLRTGKVTR